MFAVIGLGNPGARYERTRHNAGVWVVERLASLPGVQTEPWREKTRSRYCKLQIQNHQGFALLPQGYMNESGQVVAPFLQFYKIAPRDLVVVHDELDIDPGTVKIKRGGTSSHNGVSDLCRVLGTTDFVRVRIGIGHPRTHAESSQDVSSWVLSVPRPEDRQLIESAAEEAARGIVSFFEQGIEAAQRSLHKKKNEEKEDTK